MFRKLRFQMIDDTLERAKETTTIPPAMQKIICILNGAAHQCPESEVRITMKSPS
jgi:hypothetical protein